MERSRERGQGREKRGKKSGNSREEAEEEKRIGLGDRR